MTLPDVNIEHGREHAQVPCTRLIGPIECERHINGQSSHVCAVLFCLLLFYNLHPRARPGYLFETLPLGSNAKQLMECGLSSAHIASTALSIMGTSRILFDGFCRLSLK